MPHPMIEVCAMRNAHMRVKHFQHHFPNSPKILGLVCDEHIQSICQYRLVVVARAKEVTVALGTASCGHVAEVRATGSDRGTAQ